MSKKIFLFLILILVLAGCLRLPYLSHYPVGFTPDEAAQGYTAYSILETGKDEWGVFLPLSPRSFGDYKPPFYTYLLIPSVAIFGLNELAVRLPAALFGVFAVLVTFLLIKELFKRYKFSDQIGLLAAFFLAISPWHLQLTRGGFEASLLVFLIPLGLWLFLKGLEKNILYLSLAALPLGFSLFTYHSAKFFTPLIVIILIAWQFERIKKNWRGVVYFSILFGIFLVLFGLTSFSGGSTRALDITIFNPTAGWGMVADLHFDAVKAGVPDMVARFFNNKAIYLLETLIKNYFQYFSLEFLFINGPAEGFYGMLPGQGVLYLFELPLVLIGLYSIFRKKISSGKFILVCLLLAPIAAAFTGGPGYAANRAITMLPFWSIISALGGIVVWQALSKKLDLGTKRLVLMGGFLVITFSLIFFLEAYFIHGPIIIAESMRDGWREAIAFLEDKKDDYQTIIVSRMLSEPQAYVMFYGDFPPQEVQKESVDWLRYEDEELLFLDQLGEYHLGKYTFRHLHFPVDKDLEGVLLVGGPKEFLEATNIMKVINYPNGEPAILIIDPEKN